MRREGFERLFAIHKEQVRSPWDKLAWALSLIVRPSYGEFMTLFSKTVAERTRPGQRQDVEEQGGLISNA